VVSENSVAAFETADLGMLDWLAASASSLLRFPGEEEEPEPCTPAGGGGGSIVADIRGGSSGSGRYSCDIV